MNLFEAKQLLKKHGYRLISEDMAYWRRKFNISPGNRYTVIEMAHGGTDKTNWLRVVTVTTDLTDVESIFYNYITSDPSKYRFCIMFSPSGFDVPVLENIIGKKITHESVEEYNQIAERLMKYYRENDVFELNCDYADEVDVDTRDMKAAARQLTEYAMYKVCH